MEVRHDGCSLLTPRGTFQITSWPDKLQFTSPGRSIRLQLTLWGTFRTGRRDKFWFIGAIGGQIDSPAHVYSTLYPAGKTSFGLLRPREVQLTIRRTFITGRGKIQDKLTPHGPDKPKFIALAGYKYPPEG